MTRLLRLWILLGVGMALAAIYFSASSTATAGTRGSVACPSRGLVLSVATPRRKTLVAPGARTVLLCRYRTVPTQQLLKAVRISKRSTVRELTKSLDALKPVPQGPETTACPEDDGMKVLAVFTGFRGRAERVVIQTSGCSEVDGGGLHRTALPPPGQRLIRLVKALTS